MVNRAVKTGQNTPLNMQLPAALRAHCVARGARGGSRFALELKRIANRSLAHIAYRQRLVAAKRYLPLLARGNGKMTWDETPDSCCKMGIKKAQIISA